MRHLRRPRSARAAAIAAAALLLLSTAQAAFADSAAVDGNAVTVGVDSPFDLGTFAPGEQKSIPVAFVVTCTGTSHVDAGASVAFEGAGQTIPPGGSANIPGTTVGPIASFPADGNPCAVPAQSVRTTLIGDIGAPTTPGHYTYSLVFMTSTSNGDTAAVGPAAGLTLTLTVPGNTPPTLHLPADMTVEGNETNGASVTWTATASDKEDATAPDVDCSPASGSHFDLGTTTVDCSATDTDGVTTPGSFDVTVADTTRPTLSNVPAAMSVVTTSASGATVSYSKPGASDVVDPSPNVACSPASGSVFPLATTTVTCTATDASGNEATADFTVTVRLAETAFDSPIGPSNVLDANGSRSIPVKAWVRLDGSDVTSGTVRLVVRPCAGGSAVRTIDLVWSSGRWTGKLDTTGLGAGCWRASVVVGSGASAVAAGSFDVRVADTTVSSKPLNTASAGSNAPKH